MNAKILVVEDHPEVLETLMLLFKWGGCSVVAASTGRQGWELAQDGDFDLITLDIDLPGINGFDLCHHLKQIPALRQIPVVFVSGRDCDDDMRHGLALGAADYITKPFDSRTFVSRVLSHIRPKPKAQAASAGQPK